MSNPAAFAAARIRFEIDPAERGNIRALSGAPPRMVASAVMVAGIRKATMATMPQECLVKPAPAALPGPPAGSLTLPCAAPQNMESVAGVNRPGAPVTPQVGEPREGTVYPAGAVQQSNATRERRPHPAAAPEGAAGNKRGGSTMLRPRASPLPPPTMPRSGRRSRTCTSIPSGSEF